MWAGGINGSRRARFDRFLVSDDWDCLGEVLSKKFIPIPFLIIALLCWRVAVGEWGVLPPFVLRICG